MGSYVGNFNSAMSSSHGHSYSRLRAAENHASKARTTQHRSINRYSPYTRPTHLSPAHNRQRFSSPPSPLQPVHSQPTAGSKSSTYQRYRIGDGDVGTHDNLNFTKPYRRFDGLVGDSEECPGCPVHPPSTRNNNWLEPTAASTQHRSRYRSYDGHEEEEAGSPLRLHSPPRHQTGTKPTLQSLQKRMDHFDQVLTKLARDVADVKRRGLHETGHSSMEPGVMHNSSHQSSGPAPYSTDMDRLDRMMDELHFLKNRTSPAREHYTHYSPERRGTFDSRYGSR